MDVRKERARRTHKFLQLDERDPSLLRENHMITGRSRCSRSLFQLPSKHDMPFSRADLLCRLTRLFSSAAAASSEELLPWLLSTKRKRWAPEAATTAVVPAAAAKSPARRALSNDADDDPKQLFALFSQAARQPGFRHDHPSYKTLVSRFTRLEGPKAVHRILFHMRNEKLPRRPAILLALIDVCASPGFPVNPLSVLLSSGPPVHEKVFVRLVDKLIETGRLETAKSLFSNDDLVSKLGFPLRVRHYIGVVRACCDRGEVSAAIELLDEMSQRGMVPDVFSYGSVVAGICRGGAAMEDALAVVEQMRRAEREPDVVVYNTLVHGWVQRGEVERAEGVVREMEEGGVGCDAGTYNTLMGGAGCCGGVDGVEVLRRMMARGVAPDAITFTALFGRLEKEGRAAEAGSPFGVMVKLRIRPSGVCRRVLVDGGIGGGGDVVRPGTRDEVCPPWFLGGACS